MQRYVLYNPLAGIGKKTDALTEAKTLTAAQNAVYIDVTNMDAIKNLFSSLKKGDVVCLCGGDGTLNRFINDIPYIPENEIYYYPTGSGNDFYRDVSGGKTTGDAVLINRYLVDLPVVVVGKQKHKFINNVGFGIDGYCCETGDKLHEKKPHKKVSYTRIAVKGLLFDFQPVNAIVTVDGKEYAYQNVYLAPTMNGKYYGGGMMPTPQQNRLAEDKRVSVMIMHGKSKLKTLKIFPSIFTGKHVERTDCVEIKSGKEIKVVFDRPTALQIDGETISDVTEYTVRAAV